VTLIPQRSNPFYVRLLGLGSLVAEVGGCGTTTGEKAGEEGLNEGVEDDLCTTSLGEGHPENKDELESVVEWEPVDSVDCTLKDGQEGICDPVGEPLSIISSAGAEQSLKRVVSRKNETRSVNEKLASNVEEDQEEVESS